jgi:hypothetical protein
MAEVPSGPAQFTRNPEGGSECRARSRQLSVLVTNAYVETPWFANTRSGVIPTRSACVRLVIERLIDRANPTIKNSFHCLLACALGCRPRGDVSTDASLASAVAKAKVFLVHDTLDDVVFVRAKKMGTLLFLSRTRRLPHILRCRLKQTCGRRNMSSGRMIACETVP